MHRTYFVPRLIAWWSLAIGLMLHMGAPASAQEKGEVPVTPLTMSVNTTHIHRSITKLNFKRIENPNPKVLRVQQIKHVFDQVISEAISPGRSRVKLYDLKDNPEVVDVIVVSERVQELRNMIQKAVPASNVTVTSTDSGATVALTGYVKSTDDARVVQQAAASMFGTDNVINNVQIGGVQQVQLEVVVAVANRSEARNMAFSWMLNRPDWFLATSFGLGPLASAISTSVAGGSSNITVTGANIPFGVMTDRTSFFGFLNALKTEGLSKILAEPRIVTLSGRPATFVSGGETPILTSSGVGAPS